MIHNIADVTPGGSTVALKATRTPANWLIVSAPTGNAADIRVGDSTTGTGSGVIVKAGTSLILPAISDDNYLDLAQVYLYGSTTDKAYLVYGVH